MNMMIFKQCECESVIMKVYWTWNIVEHLGYRLHLPRWFPQPSHEKHVDVTQWIDHVGEMTWGEGFK